MHVHLCPKYSGVNERPDVETDTIVDVGLPPDGLLGHPLPPHVDVIGWRTIENQLESALKILGGGKARIRAGPFCTSLMFLAVDPCAKRSERELFQSPSVELVVIDDSREPVFTTVPDMPQERPVVENPHVLGKERVSEPVVQPPVLASCIRH